MLERRTVRVFVSSTFRDMHAERDHLVKKVFPALRERLDPYRVDLVDVDLRWGITEAQAADGRVLGLCLAEIEACHPYFIGVLGQRYGWVPDHVPDETVRRHRWLDGETDKSITELEVLYGALADEAKEARSFFYLRDPAALADVPADRLPVYLDEDPQQAERLAALKDRIRAETDQWTEYPARWDPGAYDRPTGTHGRLAGLDAFGERVLEDLWEAIRDRLQLPEVPPHETYGSVLDRENDAQTRFIDDRLTGVSREVRRSTQRALLDYALGRDGGPSRPLLLAGPPGSGKSTSLSLLVRQLREAPEAGRPVAAARFVGASAASTSLVGVLAQVLDELALAFDVQPDRGRGDLRDLVRALREAFEGVPEGERFVLVLDAVNQFDDGETAERLSWLPATLPETVRVVLSAIDRDAEGELTTALANAQARRFTVLDLDPLAADERRRIAREVPAIAAKTLGDDLLDLLLANPTTENPLFLRVALEEMRGSVGHEALRPFIERLPTPGGDGSITDALTGLFDGVLERIEGDFVEPVVRRLVGLMAAARRGLTEPEMVALTDGGEGADDLFPVLRQLRPYLMRRGEVWDFFHGALAAAARARYLPDETARRDAHDRLADHFLAQPDYIDTEERRQPNARRAEEIVEHLHVTERWGDLVDVLQTFEYLQARVDLGDPVGLAYDFAKAAEVLPPGTPERDVLRVLGRAVEYDMAFLSRHPEGLFQQVWNRAWWWDAPVCAAFLDPVEPERAPWLYPGLKASALVELWRETRRDAGPWFRSIRPPADLHTSSHRILHGHDGFVEAVSWSPDGLQIATASWDSTARVWDALNGHPVTVLRGHKENVALVSWSPSGQHIATSSRDGTARVWDVASGAEVASMHCPEEPDMISWRPDGSKIHGTTEIRAKALIWDAFSGSEVYALSKHGGTKMRWSPDCKRLAIWTGSLEIVEVMSEVNDKIYYKSPYTIDNINWSPDSNSIALISNHKLITLRLGLTTKLSIICDKIYMDNYVIEWSPDSTMIATGSTDDCATIWDAASGKKIAVLRGHKEKVELASWSPDGQHIATKSKKEVRIWNAVSGAEIAVMLGHDRPVSAMSWSPDGTSLVTVSSDCTARVWDVFQASEAATVRGHEGTVRHIWWSPDGQHFVTASSDGTARVWDASSGVETVVLDGHEGGAMEAAWSPDSACIGTSSGDGTVRVWDSSSGVEVAVMLGHDDWVGAMSFSPNGEHIATASVRGAVRVWDARSGLPIAVMGDSGKKMINAVSWSPCGTMVATASWDCTACVWDASSGEAIAVMRGHEGGVMLVCWSSDGTQIATASHDGTARIWDAVSGVQVDTPDEERRAILMLDEYNWGPSCRFRTETRGGEARVLRTFGGEPLAHIPTALLLRPSPSLEPFFVATSGPNIYLYHLEHI